MISSTNYEQRKIAFELHKSTLTKEPTDDVKKEYWVGCYTKDDWEFIHDELMKDGSLEDNIPTSICDCSNNCLQSDTRGVYLLTDTEATNLLNHPRVKYLHINAAAYPGTYTSNPDDISDFDKTDRYSSTVKHLRVSTNSYLPSSPDSTLLNRGGYQLLRHTQKIDPWNGQDEGSIINDRISQCGTGKGVDVIVCDTDMWFGHIEFQNPNAITDIKQSDNSTAGLTTAPTNYVGTNVLKSGFATSSSTGTCELLDLVLDAPYYIDKEWFEADVGNRLMDRWDGTKVPVESVARSWWSNSSNRSAAFSSVGTVTIPNGYTRAKCNGSNTAYHTGYGYHGTPCASQAYGRQYGWAYNANKWFLNLYGTNDVGFEAGFDMQKIFHQNKPNRASDNTKNPTISSNSWSCRQSVLTSGYYYFREGVTGGSGVSYSSRPAFMNYFNDTRCPEYVDSHAAITAGHELIESGVIFVCAAGNRNQKIVQSNHPDYNNYYASEAEVDYADAKTNSVYSSLNFTPTYNSTNRPGFPQQIGVDTTTTPYTYKTISIGALDNDHTASGLERKADYSNMGNAVDCFASAHSTVAACDNNFYTNDVGYERYDAYYMNDGVDTSAESADCLFSGTSSACPISVGIIATKLEYNRTWTQSDIKDWLSTNVQNTTSSYFYQGTEATTATSSDWSDDYNLQGAELKIIYDALTGNEPVSSVKFSGNGLNLTGVSIQIK